MHYYQTSGGFAEYDDVADANATHEGERKLTKKEYDEAMEKAAEEAQNANKQG